MMNTITKFIIFYFLILSTAILKAEDKAKDKKEALPKGVYNDVKIKDEAILKKLMEIPEVKEQFDLCKSQTPPNKPEEIPGCIWKEAAVKEKVKEFYEKEESANPAPKTKEVKDENNPFQTNLTDRKSNLQFDYKNNPTAIALSEFYKKKFEEIFKNDPKEKNKIATVGHDYFIALFKSEMGKTIINSLTAFCLETNKDCRTKPLTSTCKIDSLINVKENIDSLSKTNFDEANGLQWKTCISNVSEICYAKIVTDDDTSQKACLVMDYIKSAKKGIQVADEQEKFYKTLKMGPTLQTNFKSVEGELKARSDHMTQITSTDINNDINLKKANADADKEVSECEANPSLEKCKKFLDVNTNQNTEALAEYGLRQMAREEKLKKELNKDEKGVINYLKEEGLSKDQINKMIKGSGLEAVKNEITKRYEKEREAIIKEMADKIKRKTSEVDGAVNTSSDKGKITKIKSELSSKLEEFKNIIQFNNIVSSYLEVGDEKKKFRNTSAIYAEIEALDDKDGKGLKEKLGDTKNLSKKDETVNLEVKTINSHFLKYKNQEVEKNE